MISQRKSVNKCKISGELKSVNKEYVFEREIKLKTLFLPGLGWDKKGGPYQ